MSVPLFIALESTPLLAPIVRSNAPIDIPSLVDISCILDKILPITLKIIPVLFAELKIITIFAAHLTLNVCQRYEKRALCANE